eukprot:1661066-Rhodomonas_salina.2
MRPVILEPEPTAFNHTIRMILWLKVGSLSLEEPSTTLTPPISERRREQRRDGERMSGQDLSLPHAAPYIDTSHTLFSCPQSSDL